MSQNVPFCPRLSSFVPICPRSGPQEGQKRTNGDKTGHFGTNWETPPFSIYPHLAPLKNGGLRGVWPPFLEIGRNRPFSPFFCLFSLFSGGCEEGLFLRYGGVTNGGLRGVWPPFLEIGRNRPFSPFFCLFSPFSGGCEEGLFLGYPQISLSAHTLTAHTPLIKGAKVHPLN